MNRQCKNCRARCTGVGKEGNANQCTFYTEQGSSLPPPWRSAQKPPKVPVWMNWEESGRMKIYCEIATLLFCFVGIYYSLQQIWTIAEVGEIGKAVVTIADTAACFLLSLIFLVVISIGRWNA